MKKAVKAKVVGIKIGIHIYLMELLESIKDAICFDVIQLKISKLSWKDSYHSWSFASANDRFSKNRAFSNDLKGLVLKSFLGGKPPDP